MAKEQNPPPSRAGKVSGINKGVSSKAPGREQAAASPRSTTEEEVRPPSLKADGRVDEIA